MTYITLREKLPHWGRGIVRAFLLAGALAGMALCVPAQAQIAFRAATQASSAAGEAAPNFQAAGTAVSGTAAVTPAWPAHAIGDIALLFVESTGGQAATLSTPAGFVAITGSPQNTGTTTNGTRITVFWARATSTAMPAPTVADPGDHVYAQILTYRGVIASGNPWDVTGGGVKATASTSVTVTGVTTTGANELIVQAVARDNDNAAAAFSAQANANLTGITERSDAGTTQGNGGGFAVWDGVMETAGATGNTTATVTSSINAFLTVALRPADSVLTINVPAGTTLNDVMIASITYRPCSNVSAAACTTTITPPAGWTQVNSVTDQTTGGGTGGFGNRLFVYQRVVTGAEPANYTWTFGGEVVHAGAAGGILSFSGADTTTPVIAEGGALSAASTNSTAPSVALGGVTGAMLVTSHSNNSSATWTAPAGMTSRVNVASLTVPDDLGLALQMNTLPNAPDPTVARTATWTSPPAADTGDGHTLVLQPVVVPVVHSRILNDDAGRTPVAAESVDVTNWNKSTKFLVSIAIQTSAGSGDCRNATGANKLEWSNVTDAPGVWNTLGTAAGPEMILFNSANLTNGNALTQAESQITGTGSYVNGEEIENNNSFTWTNRVRQGAFSAIQFPIDPSGGIDGKQYQFRYIIDTLCSVAAGTNVVSVNVTLATPVTIPGSFNAFETSTAAGATTGVIKTKIAGSTVSLDVVALNTLKTAVLPTFAGAVKVEVLDASNNSGALDGNGCRSSWSSIQTLSPNPAFVVTDLGRKTISFTQADSYPNARLRITFPATGTATATGCSADNFAIRPNTLASFAVTDADWQTVGTGRALNDVTFGTITHKAGRLFSVRATAVNAAGTPATTINYAGAPTATLTACAGAACTAAFGSLTLATTFAAGQLSSDVASYSDVGSFQLQLVDSAFAAVDAADTAADCTATGRNVCSGTLVVGRFVPDHFALTAAGSLAQACSSGGFTYLGQSMSIAGVTIEARNFANVKTNNYAGANARLSPTSFSVFGFGARDTGGSGTDLTSRIDPGSATSSALGWNSGQLIFAVSPFAINKASGPDGPFAATNIGIAPTDSDGVTLQTGDFNIDVDATGGSDHARIGGASTNWRFGRLRLSNALGSERLSLAVPMQTEYWKSSGFVLNTDDSCTTISNLSVGLGSYKQNLASGNTSVGLSGAFSAGQKTLTLSAPGANKNGSVDVVVNLAPNTTVNSCNTWSPSAPAPSGADMTYLRSTWCLGSDHDPVARANFGLYGGSQSNQSIYQRENY